MYQACYTHDDEQCLKDIEDITSILFIVRFNSLAKDLDDTRDNVLELFLYTA